MKKLIIALGLIALMSCEKADGCGEIINKRIKHNLYLQIEVEFDDGARWVNVEADDYLNYMPGDIVCF